LTAEEYVMTDPTLTDAISRWGLIVQGSGRYHPSHTRQDWAQIADATRNADARLRHATPHADAHAPTMRGDDAWCQIACETYTRLHDAAAYGHRRPGGEPVCYADEDIIRAWLDAPWVPVDERLPTMLHAHGLDLRFDPDRQPAAASVTMLVSQAQDAGVFGIPDHRINLWRYFGDGTFPEHTYRVTVRPPDGPGITSSLIGADELPSPGRDPVAVIVGVLQGVADVANELLNASSTGQAAAVQAHRLRSGEPPPAPPVPRGVEGHTVGTRGQAFPPLGLHRTPAASAELPPSPPGPEPRRPRT
jgi:hypothetical protein